MSVQFNMYYNSLLTEWACILILISSLCVKKIVAGKVKW
jgi:hypothetical protein